MLVFVVRYAAAEPRTTRKKRSLKDIWCGDYSSVHAKTVSGHDSLLVNCLKQRVTNVSGVDVHYGCGVYVL